MSQILHTFHHGLGDSVMFTAVLAHLSKHRPNQTHSVQALVGKHSAFGAAGFHDKRDLSKFANVFNHDWSECWNSYHDAPGTKTAQCIREKFSLTPSWEDLRYSVPVGAEAEKRVDEYVKTLPSGPFCLIHYEGNTSKGSKDLRHEDVREVCDWLISKGYTPVILDWDRRSPLPDGKTVFCPDVENPLWRTWGTGDAETIVALCNRAALFIGIDSGPSKCAYATSVPTVGVWTGHHPYHYCDNAPNAIHVLPEGHENMIRGNKVLGLAFFMKHYKHVCYQHGKVASYIKLAASKVLGIPHNPMADATALTATEFGVDYYEQHKRSGLDYLSHGGWQEEYGRWMVEALGLQGRVVLDVGCACGSLAAGFARAGAVVSGCDVNEHMVNLGRGRWLREQLKICDASNLHYWADETFHLVHSAQVFEHFKPDVVPCILRELWRVTKVGGLMFAAFDTTEMYARQARDLSTEDATHTCVKPMGWWDDLLSRAGWVRDASALQCLTDHPGTFFKRYDWDFVIMRKVG